MAIVNKAYTFTNGQTSDGTQVNQDFDNLYTLVNGNIDSANLKALGVATSNIAAEAVTPAKTEGLTYSTDLYGSTGFVQSGLTATKDGTALNQANIATGITHVAQADGTLRRFAPTATNFRTTSASATYYLDFNPDGTWSWATGHSTQTGYVTIATVTSDASSNVNVITDTRPIVATLISSKVAKSGDTMTGALAITLSLPTGVNTSDVPSAWPNDGIAQYKVFGSGTLQNQPSPYGVILHQAYGFVKYQFFYEWIHPNGGSSGTFWYRHAGDSDTSWGKWMQIPQVVSGGYKLQSGKVNGNAASAIPITFPTAFSTVPIVVCTASSGAATSDQALSVATTGFSLQSSASSIMDHYWFAIGS